MNQYYIIYIYVEYFLLGWCFTFPSRTFEYPCENELPRKRTFSPLKINVVGSDVAFHIEIIPYHPWDWYVCLLIYHKKSTIHVGNIYNRPMDGMSNDFM